MEKNIEVGDVVTWGFQRWSYKVKAVGFNHLIADSKTRTTISTGELDVDDFGDVEVLFCQKNLEVIAKAKPISPVREVTRKEIVPGIYGRIEVATGSPGYARVRFCGATGEAYNAMVHGLTPDELEAAAKVLLDIAVAVKENTK